MRTRLIMPPMRTVRATCPFDCPDACGLLVDVEGDRVVKVRGDPDHPYSQGTLCPKMNDYERSVHAAGPAHHAAACATGPKGEGKFRRVSWDEAIALVAGRLQGDRRRPRPRGHPPLLLRRDHGARAAQRRPRLLPRAWAPRGSTAPSARRPRARAWKAVMGDTLAPHPDEVLAERPGHRSGASTPWPPASTSLQRVKEARRRGAEVWLVDTYRTPTADLADRVFLVRPGSDGALALGMAHVLFRDGLADRAFLRRAGPGLGALPRRGPARSARPPGRPGADRARRGHRGGAGPRATPRPGRPSSGWASGLSRYGNGAMNVRCITCLPAVAGAWAKPGGGLLALHQRQPGLRRLHRHPRGPPAAPHPARQHEPARPRPHRARLAPG